MFELSAYSKDEAISKAPFEIVQEVTQAWKKANAPMSGNELREFVAEKLKITTNFESGKGILITIEPGIPNTRKAPYSWAVVPRDDSNTKYESAFELVDDDGNVVAFSNSNLQSEAVKLARSLYIDKGYTGNLTARRIKVATTNPNAFEFKYVPSKDVKVGRYLAFGIPTDKNRL